MKISSEDLEHVLDHTNGLWSDLRGERIFIAGGTGFFGRWLVESFAWAADRLGIDTQAVVLSRDPERFRQTAPHLANHPALRFVQGDVRSFDFPDGTFSHVIHAATDASAKLNSEHPLVMLDTIVAGTRRTLDFAAAHGTKRFLLTSSGAVYGRQPSEMTHVPEDYPGAPDPLDAKSAYGEGKRMAEHLGATYARHSTIEMKITRGFAFVGPYLPLDIHFAIGNFIRDGLNGGPIVIRGDGTPLRSYLYAADLAVWLWTILVNGQSLRPYNIGSDEAFSVAEVAGLVADQFQPRTTLEIHGRPDPQKPVERYVPDITRARDELGLRPWIPIQTAILRTVQSIRSE
jgi:dTDP-glucose 4,6-dehydratase